MRAALATVIAVCIGSTSALTYTIQFRQWYHQYGDVFEEIKHANCSQQYATYLSGVVNETDVDLLGGVFDDRDKLTQPLIACILSHTNDYIKSVMGSAQVLLGIMPTVLALIGASTEELSMLACVGRRPLLAFLLSAGSPSVYFGRAFVYHDPVEILQDRKYRLRQARPRSPRTRVAIAVAQYALALLTFANIAIMNWELGVKSICLFWTFGIEASILWACLGVMVHMWGCLVLRLRLRGFRGRHLGEVKEVVKARQANVWSFPVEVWSWIARLPGRITNLAETEFVPCAADGYKAMIIQFVERKTFLVVDWVLSVGTILHIIFGTLVFSSLIFLGVNDALVILARYMASALTRRIIVMYELAGLRETCIATQGNKHGALSVTEISEGRRMTVVMGPTSLAKDSP